MTNGNNGFHGLIADIGGTNARFALIDAGGLAHHPRTLLCADFPDIQAAIAHYLGDVKADYPPQAALAVASPVTGDKIRMTNHPWSFSIRALKSDLGVASLRVVNDFAAIALSIPRLGEDDRALILAGRAGKTKPIAVIGPGTGLGVAGLIPIGAGESWHVLASEGGHVSMAARGKRQAALLSWIEDKYGHASAERVLSGPGLVVLHDALSALERLRAFHPVQITPDKISANALSRSCPICVEALDLFMAMLGTMAGNLALTLGAEGGVYIAGGIVPRLIERLKSSAFAEHFYDKGRFRDYLQSIPVFVITHPHPAFPGLAGLIAPLTP